MRRFFNLFLLAAMLVGAVMTYQLKLRTEQAAGQVASLKHDIDSERGEIALLRAELSLLLQPGRVQAVVEEHADYFGLVPFSPDQLGAIEEIPLRPVTSDTDARTALARLASGADSTVLQAELR
ncbi:MAG: cell division protein FtsL [Alphaproteobacteria bacterium]